MNWSDIPTNPAPKTLRQFAAAWLVFFLALGAEQYLRRGHHAAGLVLGVLAVGLGGLGLCRPRAVRWLFVGWMALTFPVGWVLSQVMLVLLFYCLVTPIAVVFRLCARDPLARKWRPNCPTFWTPKATPRDVRSYFRQY